jgi:regulatory protein
MTGPGGGGGESSSSAHKRRRRPEPSPTQRALVLLTRREHSRQELARKLAHRGVEAGDAQAAIDKLVAAGWQDDARFAASVVRNRASAGYGPVFIRAELGTHGLGSEAVALAMDGFEGDWVDNARDLLARRHPEAQAGDRAAQRKAADFLLRRGFSMQHIRAALSRESDAGGQDRGL